jgi:glycosyltransferase involved in cell wall biosynthesis
LKILYDPQIFSLQKYGGISRYFARMAEEMIGMDQNVSILAGYHINYYLKDSAPKLVKGKYLDRYPSRSIRAFRTLNEYTGRLRTYLSKPDLIHETYFSSQPIIKSSKPRFVTVYDMIQEVYPECFKPEELVTAQKKEALHRADHIISISHHTKKDLCKLFSIPSEKVSVVHLAADAPLDLDPIESQNQKPFMLYVGLRSEYKNFSNFLRAYASSEKLKNELNVLAFGGGGFSSEEKLLIHSLGLSPNQVIHKVGDDLELAKLYAQAQAFVYPSLYEGFGIPPLEAMSYGCPVVSSNTSSLPEVIGDAALTFDPLNLDEMADQLEKIIFDQDTRSRVSALGYKQSSKFSWEKTAAETLKVYESVV